MKSITRRSVTTGLAAAVTVMHAAGLPTGARIAPGKDDPLFEAIQRYRVEVAALNSSSGLSDEEVDAWCHRCDTILADATAEHEVQSEAAAHAVIDLVLDEPQLLTHFWFGNELAELVRAARGFLAAAGGSAA